MMGEATDVPSPTFTLVQSYQAPSGLAVMHMDLYRLEHPEEVFELGVEDSFYEAANLVEWPSKMGSYWPAHAMMIRLAFDDRNAGEGGSDKRQITIQGAPDFIAALARKAAQEGLIS